MRVLLVIRGRTLGSDTVLGVSAYVWSEPEVRLLLAAVRRRSDAVVVVGGPQDSDLGLDLGSAVPVRGAA